MISAALLFNVLFNHRFIQSDSRDEIPHTPYAAVDVHLTYEFELLLQYGT